MSEELNVKGNIYDIIEAYLNCKNKFFKFYQKDYESKTNEYGAEDVHKKLLMKK